MIDLADALPLLVVLILSLSVHEAAHAWTADRLGDSTARRLGRITLNPLAHSDWIGTVLFPIVSITTGAPLLGWAKPVPVNFLNLKAPRRDFAIVAAAGPLSNLVLAATGAILFTVLFSPTTPSLFWMLGIIAQAVAMNVALAVFNMIPVPPLDGGNVLAGLLPESGARLIDGLRPYGFFILYALLLTGLLSRIMLPLVDRITRMLL